MRKNACEPVVAARCRGNCEARSFALIYGISRVTRQEGDDDGKMKWLTSAPFDIKSFPIYGGVQLPRLHATGEKADRPTDTFPFEAA